MDGLALDTFFGTFCLMCESGDSASILQDLRDNSALACQVDKSNGKTILHYIAEASLIDLIIPALAVVDQSNFVGIVPSSSPFLDVQDVDGNTVLHLLSSDDANLEVVDCLLAAGPSLKIVDANGRNHFHIAAMHGCLELCKCFTDPAISSPNGFFVYCHQNLLPLDYAARYGHLPIIEYFFAVNHESLQSSSYYATYLYSAFKSAARHGHVEIVRFFMDNCNQVRTFLDSIIYAIVTNEQFALLTVLLDEYSDISILSSPSIAYHSQPKAIMFFQERGFPATRPDHNCEEEKEAATCYEFDMFCSIRAGYSKSAGNPLHITFQHGMFFEDCSDFLKGDEKTRAVNLQFMTQVHSSQNVDLLHAVIERGCLCWQSAPHISKPEIECNDLLINLALHSNFLFVKILLDHGISVDACDRYGQTALRVVMEKQRHYYKSTEMALYLIEQGADVNAFSVGRQSLLEIFLAIESNNIRLQNVLKQS